MLLFDTLIFIVYCLLKFVHSFKFSLVFVEVGLLILN